MLSRRRFRQSLALLVFLAVFGRALVPAGFMPAVAGSGLLFELCHDSLPFGMAAVMSNGGAHDSHDSHDVHGAHHEPGAADHCVFAHLLAMACLPSDAARFDIVSLPPAAPAAAMPVFVHTSTRLTPLSRGPPVGAKGLTA